jgi:hypothetical protein
VGESTIEEYPGMISVILIVSILFVELRTELDAVSSFSEIVPDTVIFDDFDRYLFSYGYLLIMLATMTLFNIFSFNELLDSPLQPPLSVLPFFWEFVAFLIPSSRYQFIVLSTMWITIHPFSFR